MTLIKFDPFRNLDQAADRMRKIMSNMEQGIKIEGGGFIPIVDIAEDSKAVYFHVELPGIKKEDVKVNVDEDNVLIIKGEKKPLIPKDTTVHRNETSSGEFERRFILPDDLDKDKIEAKYENGLLDITIMKEEKPEPKEVEIKF